MTDLTTMPENHENIRTGIVELLKAARSRKARVHDFPDSVWKIGIGQTRLTNYFNAVERIAGRSTIID